MTFSNPMREKRRAGARVLSDCNYERKFGVYFGVTYT